VLPCLNEETRSHYASTRHLKLTRQNLRGEVIVVDNGSTDDSIPTAEVAGGIIKGVSAGLRERPSGWVRCREIRDRGHGPMLTLRMIAHSFGPGGYVFWDPSLAGISPSLPSNRASRIPRVIQCRVTEIVRRRPGLPINVEV